jgi:hypothetical protein
LETPALFHSMSAIAFWTPEADGRFPADIVD